MSYAAAKVRVVSMTHAMSVSLGSLIQVRCISPGRIVVDNEGRAQNDVSLAINWKVPDRRQHPIGRAGIPSPVNLHY